MSLLCLMFTAGCAWAQSTQPESVAPDASADRARFAALSRDSSIDQVLDALHARGTDLSSFDADVTLTFLDDVSMDSHANSGRVFYQRKDGGDSRILVQFTNEIVGRRMRDKKTEFLLDDGWLWERDYERKKEIRRQVVRPGQRINLLKLGEGPFPLPIGQSTESVHRMFQVSRIPEAPDDPPGTIHIQLVPRPDTQFQSKFKSIDVWVDMATGMPRRIGTTDASGTIKRTTDLANLRVNQPVAPGTFDLPPIDATWSRSEEEFRE
jgi:hypothetical protein